MEKAVKIVNELKKKGIIKDYAIGGGIAALFYIEPMLTYDLDIFFVPAEEEKSLAILSSIYGYLKGKGYRESKEHIVIEGVPVQFIPVYNELIKEAVKNAKTVKYGKTNARVVRAEHLIAIMFQVYRQKDKERLARFIDQAEIGRKYLKGVLIKYGLEGKYKIHYGDLK